MNIIDNATMYHPPQLYVVTCSVEGGFTLSDVVAPDFENENEL